VKPIGTIGDFFFLIFFCLLIGFKAQLLLISKDEFALVF